MRRWTQSSSSTRDFRVASGKETASGEHQDASAWRKEEGVDNSDSERRVVGNEKKPSR